MLKAPAQIERVCLKFITFLVECFSAQHERCCALRC